jgi:hypothetical protein
MSFGYVMLDRDSGIHLLLFCRSKLRRCDLLSAPVLRENGAP